MTSKAFLDTNILVYFFSDEGQKTAVAEQLLLDGGIVSVQVLNELTSIARQRMKMNWEELRVARDAVLVFCPNPVVLTLEIHRNAVEIAARYGYSIYDALILAAAIASGCTTLYSEDMQHGHVVDGLRIENPFRAAPQV